MNRTLMLMVLMIMVALGFGLGCQSDSEPASVGSSKAADSKSEAEPTGAASPTKSAAPTGSDAKPASPGRTPSDAPAADPAAAAPAPKAEMAMGDGEAPSPDSARGPMKSKEASALGGIGKGRGGEGFGVAGKGGGAKGGDGYGRGEKKSKKVSKPAKAPVARDVAKDDKMVDRDDRARKRAALPQAGRLTAGAWRDLDHWDFWRGLFTSSQQREAGKWTRMEAHWGYYTAQRIPVEVKSGGNPVRDAKVTLLDASQREVWQTRTNNKGKAWLFPSLFTSSQGPYTVITQSGQNKTTMAGVKPGEETLVIAMEQADAPSNTLDVMFVVDTTGSMGDELRYLQAELGSVITEVQKTNGQQLQIRTSVNFYRDQGDQYLVRPFPFTTKLDDVLGPLKEQSAGGGGDFPEAVEAALDDAVRKHTWSDGARARLMFLVLDAPPHHTPENLTKLHKLTQEAAQKGIQIIPLAGSGINKETEFLMRFLSVSTGGNYLFLTDHSGVGGSHVKPTIGPHKVELLNQLLVRLINEALS